MSAFLGPIHFWLYNKIGKQEELTKAIASMAAGNGWISDRTAYIRDLPALEDIPDNWVCPICGVGKDMFVKVD